MGLGSNSPRVTIVSVDDMIKVIDQYKALLLVDLSGEAAASKRAQFIQALSRADDGVLMRWTVIAFSADLLGYLNRNNQTLGDYYALLNEDSLATLRHKLGAENDFCSIFSLIVPYLERLNFTWQTVNERPAVRPRSRAPLTGRPAGFPFAANNTPPEMSDAVEPQKSPR